MAAARYIALIAGKLKQVAATITSAGAASDGALVALDGSGRLDPSVMPVGIGADTTSATASEALSAGDFVCIWDDAGTAKVRKADASAEGKEATGFVLDAVSSGQPALVYHEGSNTALSGLTIDARYYLSPTTPGAATTTPPGTAGQVSQFLGRAASATRLPFEADDGIVLA